MNMRIAFLVAIIHINHIAGCSNDESTTVSINSIQSACIVDNLDDLDLFTTEVSIEQSGDSIQITDQIFGNCCLKYKLDISINGDVITIQELEGRGELCRCSCGYSMTGTIQGIDPGEYRFEVYSYDSNNNTPKYSKTLLVE